MLRSFSHKAIMYNTILVFFLFSIALSLRRRLTFMKIATLLNEFPFLFSFCSSIFIFLPLSEFDKLFFFFLLFLIYINIYKIFFHVDSVFANFNDQYYIVAYL